MTNKEKEHQTLMLLQYGWSNTGSQSTMGHCREAQSDSIDSILCNTEIMDIQSVFGYPIVSLQSQG